MFPVTSSRSAGYEHKKTKVTCTTCKLKKCVGKCHFETVNCPQPPKAA